MGSRGSTLLLAGPLLLAYHAGCSDEPVDPSGAGGTGGAGGSVSSKEASSSSSTTASSSSAGGEAPHRFTVKGIVTDGKLPVEGALVMQGGGELPAETTGPDGLYSIELTRDIPGTPTVVASKVGYRTAGVEFTSLPEGEVELALSLVAAPDNTGYVFHDPGTGDLEHDNSTAYCGHCHTTFVKEFQTSMHAQAARDPIVQAIYAGTSQGPATHAECDVAGGTWRTGLIPGTATSTKEKCYVGSGVLSDLNPTCGGPAELACDDPALPPADKPISFGGCADCHAPGIDGVAGGRNLHDATGIAFDNGNHCDVCHKVRDVDMTKPPGVAGRLVLQRPRDVLSPIPPSEIRQVMFGPLPDVPLDFMGGSYQPVFDSPELCAGCHEQNQEALLPGQSLDGARWPDGLPTHSTYSEWQESAFNQASARCQYCHMPADDTGLNNSVDVTTPGLSGIIAGFARPPERIRNHGFRGPLTGTPRLIDGALTFGFAKTIDASGITIDAQVGNMSAGHAIPTGEPMRALVLVVRGTACGTPLVPSGGMTIPDVGGSKARGTVGAEVAVNGQAFTWAAGPQPGEIGDVVRVVRPTGTFDDYRGIGFFANPALSAQQKGMEIAAPIGEAPITSNSGGVITVASPIAVQPGDVVFVGDALSATPLDGAASLALAGSAGYSFSRTLVDASGARFVPHYRAVDIASDNRIPPQDVQRTSHRFALPSSCASARIEVVLLYRRIPVELARERGVAANDYVVAGFLSDVSLP